MKMLASDLDMTLLFRNERGEIYIKEEDKNAIELFQKKGNLFGVSTGRGIYTASGDVIDNIKADFYIVNSGACIYDKELNIISENILPRELIIELYSDLTRKDDIIIYCKRHTYALKPTDRDARRKIIVDTIDEADDEMYSLSLKLTDVKGAMEEAERLKFLWGNYFNIFQNQQYVDICQKGCSKGEAVLKAGKYLGVREQDIAVIGDSYNDISMFEAVKDSFTFESSDKDVKKKALHRVNSLAECIKNITERATD